MTAGAETCIALSTVKSASHCQPLPRPEKNSFGIARRNKAQFTLAVVDPRVAGIERTRAQRKISHQKLCAAAGVNPATWRALRAGEQGPKPATLERLEAALRAVPPPPKLAPLGALVRAVEALLAAAIAADPTLAAIAGNRRSGIWGARWRERLPTLALYVVAVEVEAGSNSAIGRALGMTRANVHKARNTIEELADDPRVRALLDGIATTLRGEGR